MAYQEGYTVQSLTVLSGLGTDEVITRLCAASRPLARQPWVIVDTEGALGVQWEYVSCG
jgi:hypothetical protein